MKQTPFVAFVRHRTGSVAVETAMMTTTQIAAGGVVPVVPV